MPEYKTKRLLTVPVLKFIQDQPRHIKVTDAMHMGKPQKADSEGKTKDPATLANCVNLDDGAVCQIIVGAMLKSVWNDDYPGDGYVGKCFKITKLGRNPSKQYNQYEIEEIEDPTGAEAEAESTEEETVRPARRRARG